MNLLADAEIQKSDKTEKMVAPLIRRIRLVYPDNTLIKKEKIAPRPKTLINEKTFVRVFSF
ncbi:MAG: hypothetical protein PWQ35_495 [Patescibacteria group bacterium]|nr:hypothetical protein [Patescibacteria group bacterium]